MCVWGGGGGGGWGGGNLLGVCKMDRRFMFMEKNVLRGLSVPAPGQYTNIFSETAWPIKAKLCRASLGKGNES